MKKNKFSMIIVLFMSIFVIGACGANGADTSSNKNDEYDTSMREGKQEVSNKNYSEAEKAFSAALKEKDKDKTATTYLEQTKNYVAAEAAYEKGQLAEAKTKVEKVTTEKEGLNDLVTAGKELSTKVETLLTQQEDYQKLYDDSKAQYDASKWNEAAGTIDELLSKDLSNSLFTDLKTKATALKAEINNAQAEKVKEETVVPDSKYKKERSSELIGKEFSTATGLDIKTASDDQIAAWLAEKEAANNSATSSSADTSSSAASDSSTTPTNTDEETVKIIQSVEKITGISSSDNEYYVTKESDDKYQVEIRHSHTVGDTEISNMVGMFEYTSSTNSLTKMDPITGEYKPFEKIN